MQKRTEKVMKITIVPETGSPEKSTYISFRESSDIYKAINELIARKNIYVIYAWYRKNDNKDFTIHEITATSPQEAVNILSLTLSYFYYNYYISNVKYRPESFTKNQMYNLNKP